MALLHGQKLCLCDKCKNVSASGVWLSANTYRNHQDRRLVSQIQEDIVTFPHHDHDTAIALLDASLTPAPHPISFHPAWIDAPFEEADEENTPSHPAPHYTPTPINSRLEMQEIRYELLELDFKRPVDLEYTKEPRFRAPTAEMSSSQAYCYDGLPNASPYDLTISPANALFLHQEFRLHNLMERLHKTKDNSTDPNFEIQRMSVEKGVRTALNQMFRWKREIWWEKHAGAPKPGRPLTIPLIETTRYLQLYNYGDPQYAPIVLSGILLVLILHLIFNGSQKLCEIVLGFLVDHTILLAPFLGDGRSQQIARSYPATVKTILSSIDLEPRVRRYVQCPSCYALYPVEKPYPDLCSHRPAPGSLPCQAKMTRIKTVHGREHRQPIRIYAHQDLFHWLGRFICRKEVEEMFDQQKEDYRLRYSSNATRDGPASDLVTDILESEMIRNFPWHDGKPFYDAPHNELRLSFGISGDGFGPFGNKEAKQSVSSTGIYLFCQNLPLEERQKPENIYLAGVIPGPGKPSTSQINHSISLVVDDLETLWKTGVKYTHTSKRKDGVLVRAAGAPVICDALGCRQLCGHGSPTSTFFCTFCWLRYSDIENLDMSSWPQRDLRQHRYWAELWQISNEETREQIFKDHGIRYTPLFRLPYFDPIKHLVVDTMHNLYLGLLQRHCRSIWGMDFSLADGDGTSRPRGTLPKTPSQSRMEEGRRTLRFGDGAQLHKLRVDVLFYLCVECDLRRGGKKKDFVRELVQWQKKKQPDLTPSSNSTSTTPNATTGPIAHDHTLPSNSSTNTVVTPGPRRPDAPGASARGPNSMALRLLPIDATVGAELALEIELAEDKLVRGLKLKNIRKRALLAMCARRQITFGGDDPKKDVLAEVLEEWRREHLGGSLKEETKTVVLGKNILTAFAEDRQKISLPSWVDPAPAAVGQKKQGKLSADQWRSFCTVHLVITLIRLWGNLPRESRQYQMLANFLDLVTAVEVAGLLVTSPRHVTVYRTAMNRYLTSMKALYKEAVVVPNHHFALHVPDFLKLWGPAPQTRGFGFERFNYFLQQITTNKRFGDMEITYMYTAARTANLLAFVALDSVRKITKNMYSRLQRYLGRKDQSGRGTRGHGMEGEPRSTQGDSDTHSSGKDFELHETVIEGLCAILNQELGNEVYCPSSTSNFSQGTRIHLHPSAQRLHSLFVGGVTYRPLHRAPGDSNILLHSDASTVGNQNRTPYQPARILLLFSHNRKTPDGTIAREEFCLVQYLKPLPPDLVEKDWFRKQGSIGGSLWTQQYDTRLYVIRPSSIVCHFARTAHELQEIGVATYHVLPLDRLQSAISSSMTEVTDSRENSNIRSPTHAGADDEGEGNAIEEEEGALCVEVDVDGDEIQYPVIDEALDVDGGTEEVWEEEDAPTGMNFV